MADQAKTVMTALITAAASVAVAWITAKGTAAGQAKTTIAESGTQLASLSNAVGQVKNDLHAARVESGGIPSGTIVAWYAKEQPIPPGWVMCNGTQGTPDLRGRFLRATGDIASAGQTGGAERHHHSVTIATPEGPWKGSDVQWGTTPWRDGPNPVRGRTEVNATTSDDSNLPPYFDVIYIMRR